MTNSKRRIWLSPITGEGIDRVAGIDLAVPVAALGRIVKHGQRGVAVGLFFQPEESAAA